MHTAQINVCVHLCICMCVCIVLRAREQSKGSGVAFGRCQRLEDVVGEPRKCIGRETPDQVVSWCQGDSELKDSEV